MEKGSVEDGVWCFKILLLENKERESKCIREDRGDVITTPDEDQKERLD